MDEKLLIKHFTKLSLAGFITKAVSTLAVIFSVSVIFSSDFVSNFISFNLILASLMLFFGFFQLLKPVFGFKKKILAFFSILTGCTMFIASRNLESLTHILTLIFFISAVYFDSLCTSFYMEKFSSNFSLKEQKRFYYIFNGSHYLGAVLAGISIPFLFQLATFKTGLNLASILCFLVPVVTFFLTDNPNSKKEESGLAKTGVAIKSFFQTKIGLWWLLVAFIASLIYAFSTIPFIFDSLSSINNSKEIASYVGKIIASAEVLIFMIFAFILPFFLTRFSPPSLLLVSPVLLLFIGTLSIYFPLKIIKLGNFFVAYLILRTFNRAVFQSFAQLFKNSERPFAKIINGEVIFPFGLLVGFLLMHFYPDLIKGSFPLKTLLALGSFSLLLVFAGRNKYFLALRETLEKNSEEDFSDELVGNSALSFTTEKEKILLLQPMQRSGAILRLAQKCPRSAAKIVLELLKTEKDEKALSTLVRTCGRLEFPSIKMKLEEVLYSNDSSRLSADALESLYRINKEVALENALKLLSTDNNRLKSNAIMICLRASNEKTDIKNALIKLKEMVFSDKPEFRSSACAIVGEIKSRAAIPALIKLLNDENEQVLKSAVKAASKIKNEDLEKCLSKVSDRSEELKAYVSKQVKLNSAGLGKNITRLLQTDGRVTMDQVVSLMGRMRNEKEVEIAYQVAMRFPGLPGFRILEQLSFHSKLGLIDELEHSLIPFGLDFEKIWLMISNSENFELNELGVACLGAVDEETFKNVVRRAVKSKVQNNGKALIFSGAGMRILDRKLGLAIWENFSSGENLLFDKGNQLIKELDSESARELFYWLKKQLI